MESAKNAVSSFLGGSGKQVTDVDEQVAPAVVNETIKPYRHEETTEAVDREVHQDHYHTTVQPITHRETLPEQHAYNTAPQVERTFQHGSDEQDRARVESELGQFQNTSTTYATSQSQASAPTVTGEHVHHHVHEVVQPIVHKETLQPEVVHTTIPIHERHQAPSEMHGMSTLPVKTLDDFKSMGTPLTGSGHSYIEYEGHPKPYDASKQLERKPIDKHPEIHEGLHDPERTGHFGGHSHGTHGTHGHGTTGAGLAGATAAGAGLAGHRRRGSSSSSSSSSDDERTRGSRGTRVLAGAGTGAGLASHLPGHGHQSHDHTSTSGNSAAMGSGVAGVAAGSVAHDLGRDHTRAGQVSDLNPRDTNTTFGDSGSSTVGTALGGRTEGNTGAGATSALNSDPTHHSSHGHDEPHHSSHNTHEASRSAVPNQEHGSAREPGREPSNLTGGSSEPRKDISRDDDVQHASIEGEDPSIVTDKTSKGGKLTGTGADGSHSAVFGLTPDGHVNKDTSHTSTAPKPAHGGDERKRDDTPKDVGSSVGTGEVANQMNDPRVAEKGHSGRAEYTDEHSGGKPGAGSGLVEPTGTPSNK